VRPHPVALLQVEGVSHEPEDFEAPVVETEKGADPDVVAAGLHRPAQGVEAPEVVPLPGAGRVDLGVGGVVVGLLEDLVGADPRFLDLAEPGMVERRGVDVHPPDLPVPLLDAVHVADGLGDEGGVVARMLAENEDEPLVPLRLEGADLPRDLLRLERPADRVGVAPAEPAVEAVVGALVPDVERGEEHDPVPVDGLLQRAGGGEDLLLELGRIGAEQHGRLLDREGRLGQALGHDRAHLRRIRRAVPEQRVQAAVIDEVRRPFAQL